MEKRGTVVPVAQLIDAVWGRRPPKTAAKNLQIYVYHLRQLLDDPARISRQATGYQLDIEPGELDADRFQRLTGAALAEADPTAAGALWRRALGQWRGPAYDGLHHVPLLAEAAERLAERRLTALEGRIEAELGSDQSLPDRLVAELTDLVGRWPWRERFVGQLMRALHRTGRPAQALDAYERGRRALADELGLDPGPELREVEREIRATSAPGGPAPAQLPADIADFAGREKEVDAAVDVLGKTADALSVVAISGPAGVGKTTLAVRIGHRIRGACPDGQLYVDLAGANGRPADPAAVLAAFLRARAAAAGGRHPDRLAERIACYRSMLADRRILIVLDNAADHAHIEPLLPGTPSCPVVVTSRVRLTGLPGGHLIDLRPLELSDSLTLIGRMVGPDRIGVEVAAARELARLCGGLPLALRVAGAKLAARTHWTVRDLVDRLADEHHRLDELRHRELQVRASFGLSFQGLSEPAGRLFGRLGQLDAPDLAGWVAAAVLDCPIADAESVAGGAGRHPTAGGRRPGRTRPAPLPVPRPAAGIRARAWPRRRAGRRTNRCPATRLRRLARAYGPSSWSGFRRWRDKQRGNRQMATDRRLAGAAAGCLAGVAGRRARQPDGGRPADGRRAGAAGPVLGAGCPVH